MHLFFAIQYLANSFGLLMFLSYAGPQPLLINNNHKSFQEF